MNSKELRQKFLAYFNKKGHQVLPSASLVPAEVDPSVLFNTAGMQQFKRFYLEPNESPSSRITTIQKCIRTGDIEEVGDDTHLTFFEMLGNFSFGYPEKEGSYFKEEAIKFAWEFLTKELGFSQDRIYATYFEGNDLVSKDQESLEILKKIEGLKEIKPQGFDDNFWSLGTENSPGGPTVEFYIDGVEVWNLVFNEYIYQGGKYKSAQFKGVDTGMGFERLLCKLTGLKNVYQTDLFELPYKKLHELLKTEDSISERIILDHLKAAVFIINDGIMPSNKAQGYIVRRLIRRAIVKAQQIGITENFTTKIAEEVFKTYEGVYDFDRNSILVELDKEETKFRKTLQEGLKLLANQKEITGKTLFDLYQSYGLPLEIALEEAKRQGFEVNDQIIDQYNNLIKDHQEQSRTASAGMFKGGLADAGEETTKLHTAAHLMLAALRKVLGPDVYQKGSNITPERLRFDFSYPEKMTDAQVKEVEDIVNEQIAKDLPVNMEEMKVEDAKTCGAMGVFDSKYGEKVKVYTIGPSTPDSRSGSRDFVSREICGGPHVAHTGELGRFKIVKEESSSSGVRRIKAILE